MSEMLLNQNHCRRYYK